MGMAVSVRGDIRDPVTQRAFRERSTPSRAKMPASRCKGRLERWTEQAVDYRRANVRAIIPAMARTTAPMARLQFQ
jgi:hypothetical protein